MKFDLAFRNLGLTSGDFKASRVTAKRIEEVHEHHLPPVFPRGLNLSPEAQQELLRTRGKSTDPTIFAEGHGNFSILASCRDITVIIAIPIIMKAVGERPTVYGSPFNPDPHPAQPVYGSPINQDPTFQPGTARRWFKIPRFNQCMARRSFRTPRFNRFMGLPCTMIRPRLRSMAGQ